eukprot:4678510-Alexandrium_andersonii.AAC.1
MVGAAWGSGALTRRLMVTAAGRPRAAQHSQSPVPRSLHRATRASASWRQGRRGSVPRPDGAG